MRRLPYVIVALLFAATVSLFSYSAAPRPLRPKALSLSALVAAPIEQLAVAAGVAPAPQPVDNSPAKLDMRTKTAGCQVAGPLPDHDCTPGAIFASTTLETICTPGYTQKVRNVSTSLKKSIYKEYGIAYPEPTGSYEADHLIPLELGGSNAVANLFPEAASPKPGFKEKDLVENYLHQQACDGDIPLGRAQEQIANDWVGVYNSLSQDELAQLKAQYSSWADKN